jgi:hypothetical protein
LKAKVSLPTETKVPLTSNPPPRPCGVPVEFAANAAVPPPTPTNATVAPVANSAVAALVANRFLRFIESSR